MTRHNWFTRTARKILGVGDAPTDGSGSMMALLQAGQANTGTLSEADAIKRFRHFIFTCAGRNGAAVASVPLRLFFRGATSDRSKRHFGARPVGVAQRKHMVKLSPTLAGEEIVELTDHPVLDVLRLANPRTVGFALRELTTIYQELGGNAYWYLQPWGDPARGSQPQAIWNLQPQHVKIVQSKDGMTVTGYLYGTKPEDTIAMKADEVIHFRYPNPSNPFMGLGPLQAATSAEHRKSAMDEYKNAMYDNHCRPDFIVRVPEGTPPTEIRSLEKQWDHMFRSRRGRGVNISGKPLFVTADKGIEPLNFPPNQMQDVFQAKLDRDEIYEIFGVPVQMAEIGKSRAELEAAQAGYMWLTILPRLRRSEQTLTEQLASLYDPRLFFAYDDPVPANRELALREATELARNKIITRNEARQLAGFDETEEGGDEFIASPAGGGFGGAALSARPFRSQAQASPWAADGE